MIIVLAAVGVLGCTQLAFADTTTTTATSTETTAEAEQKQPPKMLDLKAVSEKIEALSDETVKTNLQSLLETLQSKMGAGGPQGSADGQGRPELPANSDGTTPPEKPANADGSTTTPPEKPANADGSTTTPPEPPKDENGNPIAPPDGTGAAADSSTATPPEKPADDGTAPAGMDGMREAEDALIAALEAAGIDTSALYSTEMPQRPEMEKPAETTASSES